MRLLFLATAVLLLAPSCSRHLESTSTGALAPEIAGRDLDGAAFRLSDYRGKVVLLDFWGDWSPPCRAMYAHTRALVEQYDEAPFAVVGVNGDSDVGVLASQDIRWRSFWDGPNGRPGPIAEAWDVRSWPTMFLIDAKGVIRSKFMGVNEGALDHAIEELLAELH